MSRVSDGLSRMWSAIENVFVQDVPDDVALCEFDCRKGQCSDEDWASCNRRLDKAAGELSPSSTEPDDGPHSSD